MNVKIVLKNGTEEWIYGLKKIISRCPFPNMVQGDEEITDFDSFCLTSNQFSFQGDAIFIAYGDDILSVLFEPEEEVIEI